MLVDYPDFTYNSNPQSPFARRISNPFLQVREFGRAEYDLSANAGNFVAPSGGQTFDLSGVSADALFFFKLVGDSDWPVASLFSVRAGDLKSSPQRGDGSVGATGSNSAHVLQFLPATIDQTPTADINAINYFFGEGVNTGNLIVARSVVHSGGITVIGYEAH